MSEHRLSIREATEIVSNRLNVTTEKAQVRLMEADISGKVHITIDRECERRLVEAVTARLPPQTAIKPDDALAALAEGARQGALALSVVIECGMVSQDELLNWLNLAAGPDLAQLKEPKTEDILEAARAVCFDPKNDNPNTDEAERLIRHVLETRGLMGPRAKIRPILKGEEFASRRTKAGYAKRQ